jgi:hypothetical protein
MGYHHARHCGGESGQDICRHGLYSIHVASLTSADNTIALLTALYRIRPAR